MDGSELCRVAFLFHIRPLIACYHATTFFQKGRDMLPQKEKHLNAQTYYITMQQANAGGSKVKCLKAWIASTNMFILYHPTRLQICTVVWVEHWTRWEKRPCRITAENSICLNAYTCVEERKGFSMGGKAPIIQFVTTANIMWKIQLCIQLIFHNLTIGESFC